jgi:dihydropteroate synthase
MGILNVTPDSFSDGGRFLDVGAAVERGHELIRQGADLLDIGGESTRPGAEPVAEDEELCRVLPVLRRLAAETRIPLSIDTLKPAVAAAALEAGAALINHVGAGRADPAMDRLLASSDAGYIAMHMQGEPQTMQSNPTYDAVIGEVHAFFAATLERLVEAGVSADRIVLDPGIGFGKTVEHNLELLGNMPAFRDLGRPLLVGVSRKSFIGRLTGAEVGERLSGSLASTCLAVAGGAAVVRTHDVRETVQALRITEAILAKQRMTTS